MFWWSVAPIYGKIGDGLDTNMKSPFWFFPTVNGWETANLLVLVGKSPDPNTSLLYGVAVHFLSSMGL